MGHNGTQIETYAVELGSDWKAPLSGKQLEQRENILEDKMKSYFIENKGKLVIPEKELPRIEKVVNRKKWIETANLPSGVRSFFIFNVWEIYVVQKCVLKNVRVSLKGVKGRERERI